MELNYLLSTILVTLFCLPSANASCQNNIVVKILNIFSKETFPFCSTLLASVVTVTSTPTSSILQTTRVTTLTTVSTATISTTTSTSTSSTVLTSIEVDETSTSTSFVTNTITVPATTISKAVKVLTTTTTAAEIVGQRLKRGDDPRMIPIPSCIKNFEKSIISSACSCLSLSIPTFTSTSTAQQTTITVVTTTTTTSPVVISTSGTETDTLTILTTTTSPFTVFFTTTDTDTLTATSTTTTTSTTTASTTTTTLVVPYQSVCPAAAFGAPPVRIADYVDSRGITWSRTCGEGFLTFNNFVRLSLSTTLDACIELCTAFTVSNPSTPVIACMSQAFATHLLGQCLAFRSGDDPSGNSNDLFTFDIAAPQGSVWFGQ